MLQCNRSCQSETTKLVKSGVNPTIQRIFEAYNTFKSPYCPVARHTKMKDDIGGFITFLNYVLKFRTGNTVLGIKIGTDCNTVKVTRLKNYGNFSRLH